MTNRRIALVDALNMSNPHALMDKINALIGRDLGISGDYVINRWSGSQYSYDIDNPSGNHLNLGSGVMTVQDTAASIAALLDIRGGNEIRIQNATNTNSVNLKHSGTSDVMKTDDAFWTAVALNVGANRVATGAGEASIQAGFNVGPSRVVTGAGLASIQTALNVGADSAATVVGEGHFTDGIFVGPTLSFAHPGAGKILTTVSVTTGQFISQIATGTMPINVTSTTVCTNLNADMVDGVHAAGFAQLGAANTFGGNLLFSPDNTYDIGASGATRPRNFYLAGTEAIGGLASFGSGISIEGGTAAAGRITKSATVGMQIRGSVGSSLDFLLTRASDGSSIISVDTGTVDVQMFGNIQFGSPTGGKKGAGSLNAVAVYDDGAGPLTDWIYDLAYDGRVLPEDEALYTGPLLSIAETEAFAREHRHLPSMPGRDVWEATGRKFSLGVLAQSLYETVERQALHIFNLNRRLETLEARAG